VDFLICSGSSLYCFILMLDINLFVRACGTPVVPLSE
jgi:hypothetical protein